MLTRVYVRLSYTEGIDELRPLHNSASLLIEVNDTKSSPVQYLTTQVIAKYAASH